MKELSNFFSKGKVTVTKIGNSFRRSFMAVALAASIIPSVSFASETVEITSSVSEEVSIFSEKLKNDIPIIVLDNQKIRDNIKSKSLEKTVKSFISSISGKDISEADLDYIVDRLTDNNGASSIRAEVAGGSICIVVPSQINANEKSFVFKEGDENSSRYISRMNDEEFRTFSLFHEIGHCKDKSITTSKNWGTDSIGSALMVHKWEVYADIYGALQSAKELNDPKIPNKVAEMRTMYIENRARHMNDLYADQNTYKKHASGIYYTVDALKEVSAITHRLHKSGKLSSLKDEDILKMAEKITASKAMNLNSFYAVEAVASSDLEFRHKIPQAFKEMGNNGELNMVSAYESAKSAQLFLNQVKKVNDISFEKEFKKSMKP